MFHMILLGILVKPVATEIYDARGLTPSLLAQSNCRFEKPSSYNFEKIDFTLYRDI